MILGSLESSHWNEQFGSKIIQNESLVQILLIDNPPVNQRMAKCGVLPSKRFFLTKLTIYVH
jgi:hypothetical protein